MSTEQFVERVRLLCGKTDPTEAACWFIARRQAAFILSEYRIKDLARQILDGQTDGPFHNKTDIARWVEDQNEAEDWEWLDEALHAHFGK